MKRKIIALVMVLLLIPSVILGASTKYTKTEKVTYNSNAVVIDGTQVTDTVTINGTTYIKARSLAAQMDKTFDIKSNGSITINKKVSFYDFAKGNWGDNKAEIIKREGKEPRTDAPSFLFYDNYPLLGYSSHLSYSLDKNNNLIGGIATFDVTDENFTLIYNSVENALISQFGNISSKQHNFLKDYQENMDYTDRLKQGYISLVSNFYSENVSVKLILANDSNNRLRLDVMYFINNY